MTLKQHIDDRFAQYEDSPSLKEFKEELLGNATDRIEALMQSGLSPAQALEKTLNELGDVSDLAETLSLQKKQEVYSDMFMSNRNYLTPKRTFFFVLGGTLLAFGLISALVVWFSTENLTATASTLQVFTASGAALLTYMALTQETKSRFPMKPKRATLYTLASFILAFGLFVPIIVLASTSHVSAQDLLEHGWWMKTDNMSITAAVSTLIPFVLSATALFAYLILTEKDHRKPWFIALNRNHEFFRSPQDEARFGLYCGALWIASLSLTIALSFKFGLTFSWLALAAGVVGQLLLLASFSKSNNT